MQSKVSGLMHLSLSWPEWCHILIVELSVAHAVSACDVVLSLHLFKLIE
jgi:hypothetical protein